MALSGSFNTDKYSGSYGTCGLHLAWTGTQSIANNTTTIKWTLTSNGTMSSGYYYKAGPVKVTIAGQTVLNTTSRFNMKGDGAYKKTGTITITHNEDGTKSVSMSVKAAIYSASVNCEGSATYTLDRINRYALITGTENFTDEGNPTIIFSNPAGTEMVTNLKARIKWTATEGGQQVEHATAFENIPEADWSGGQHTFTISNADRASMRAACPTANTLAVTFDLQSTMNSTDYHDTKTGTMNIVNANPTAGTISYTEMDDDVYAITGDRSIIIQKQSTLRIKTLASTPQKAATIVSYSLNINGNDYTPTWTTGESPDFGYVDFIKPDVAGTYRATVTTTDSRGNTATATVDITIQQWTEPSAVYSVARRQNFYPDTILNVDGTIATVTGSTMHITERHKKTTDPETAWTQEQTLPDAQDYTITLASEDEWEIIIKVEDAFAYTEYRATVGKGIPLKFTDVHRRSFSINGLPDEDNQLYVGGTAKLKPNDTDAGVKLPHVYSDTEQIVGYWIDGSPIYERTLSLQADVTVNANAWKNSAVTVTEDIIIIDGRALYYSSQYDMFTIWNFMGIQTNTSNKKAIDLYNSRDASCTVNILIIKYIKVSQT